MPTEHLFRLSVTLPEDVAAMLAYEALRQRTTVQVVAQSWLTAATVQLRVVDCGAREN